MNDSSLISQTYKTFQSTNGTSHHDIHSFKNHQVKIQCTNYNADASSTKPSWYMFMYAEWETEELLVPNISFPIQEWCPPWNTSIYGCVNGIMGVVEHGCNYQVQIRRLCLVCHQTAKKKRLS